MTGPTHGGLFPSAADVRNYYHLRKVASVGLYVQQSTNSGREGYCTYKTLPVLTLAFSYQSSSTTAVSYPIARRGGSPFEFSR